jgi:hypothetical protein
MRLFLPQVLYTAWCLSKSYSHKNICGKSNFCKNKEKIGKRKTAQIGTNVRARVFNAGLLARSQFASGSPATNQLD